MNLDTAPSEAASPRSGKPYFGVLMCGVLSSAITLAGVWVLSRTTENFNIMGWYANYVIPAGALIVGMAAGSGYGLASWLTGVRIGRGLLLAVVLLQTGSYVAAEYLEYVEVMNELRRMEPNELKRLGLKLGPKMSFAQYYDYKARNFTWKEKDANKPGQPLGGWGYVFVLLGAAGFIGGGLLAPALLYKVPYCEPCQRYMKTQVLGVLPASVPLKKIKKHDHEAQEAHDKEQEAAAAKADEAIARLGTALQEGDTEAFQRELAEGGASKENEKLPRRVGVSLVWCQVCREGYIAMTLSTGSGQDLEQTQLEQHPVPALFVFGLTEWPTSSRRSTPKDR